MGRTNNGSHTEKGLLTWDDGPVNEETLLLLPLPLALAWSGDTTSSSRGGNWSGGGGGGTATRSCRRRRWLRLVLWFLLLRRRRLLAFRLSFLGLW